MKLWNASSEYLSRDLFKQYWLTNITRNLNQHYLDLFKACGREIGNEDHLPSPMILKKHLLFHIIYSCSPIAANRSIKEKCNTDALFTLAGLKDCVEENHTELEVVIAIEGISNVDEFIKDLMQEKRIIQVDANNQSHPQIFFLPFFARFERMTLNKSF
jgi:hypothetical protein